MARTPVYGDRWAETALEHARRVGNEAYFRAARRRPLWPEFKNPTYQPLQFDKSNFDQAFLNFAQAMDSISTQCKNYHWSQEHSRRGKHEKLHCDRYHNPDTMKTSRSTMPYNTNPFNHVENVHVLVPPGKYAVSAGELGGPTNRAEVVVHEGGSLCLDFKL